MKVWRDVRNCKQCKMDWTVTGIRKRCLLLVAIFFQRKQRSHGCKSSWIQPQRAIWKMRKQTWKQMQNHNTHIHTHLASQSVSDGNELSVTSPSQASMASSVCPIMVAPYTRLPISDVTWWRQKEAWWLATYPATRTSFVIARRYIRMTIAYLSRRHAL